MNQLALELLRRSFFSKKAMTCQHHQSLTLGGWEGRGEEASKGGGGGFYSGCLVLHPSKDNGSSIYLKEPSYVPSFGQGVVILTGVLLLRLRGFNLRVVILIGRHRFIVVPDT